MVEGSRRHRPRLVHREPRAVDHLVGDAISGEREREAGHLRNPCIRPRKAGNPPEQIDGLGESKAVLNKLPILDGPAHQEDRNSPWLEPAPTTKGLEELPQIDARHPRLVPEEGIVADQPVRAERVASREDGRVQLSIEKIVRVQQEENVIVLHVRRHHAQRLDPVDRRVGIAASGEIHVLVSRMVDPREVRDAVGLENVTHRLRERRVVVADDDEDVPTLR